MSNRALEPIASASPRPGVADCAALRWEKGLLGPAHERVVLEEPLAIEIGYTKAGQRVRRELAVTMRPPGDEEDLATGFLYGEGLIGSADEVVSGQLLSENSRGERIPTWCAVLSAPPPADGIERVSRGVITSAACGICGRTSLRGLRAPARPDGPPPAPITGAAVLALASGLARLQEIYPETGGCHGAGLFDASGEPLLVREDVGRHNAVDKVVGAALRRDIDMRGASLVLSGRAGFELIQKAAAAGVALVVSVGAPSSLAVQMAREASLTLAGFTRSGKFNVYSVAGRGIEA